MTVFIYLMVSGTDEALIDFIIWANRNFGTEASNEKNAAGIRTVILTIPFNKVLQQGEMNDLMSQKELIASLSIAHFGANSYKLYFGSKEGRSVRLEIPIAKK